MVPERRDTHTRGLQFEWDRAVEHLRRRDRKFRTVIDQLGGRRLEIRRARTPFQALVRSIVYQQISGRAAAAIHARLIGLFPGTDRVTAGRLLALSDAQIRGAGISEAKLKALRDLATRVSMRQLPSYNRMLQLEDDEIVEALTQVRGIGRWSAEMLLIFHLGRPDVLPVGDLGVRRGFSLIHGLNEMPGPDELRDLALPWKPYRSVGSWYCWRAVELQRQ
jgi:3-methyladenine DNA glycosylase/8-oxoguanine DNA glycosylase